MDANGWCTRCGTAYERPARPACECAGDPPVNWKGKSLTNLHEDTRAYLTRVHALRHVPAVQP